MRNLESVGGSPPRKSLTLPSNESHNPAHWRVLNEREVFVLEPWMRISVQEVRLPDGRVVQDFGRIQLPNYISVFAQTLDGRVIVERQYKHGVGFVSLNLPAGMIEPSETPMQAAQRELLEETGYRAENWTLLGEFVTNGNYGCGTGYVFLADNAKKIAVPDSDDLEDIETLLYTMEELIQALVDGKVATSGAAAAISMGHFAVSGIIKSAQKNTSSN